jgi:DNA-binding IclR family transcriptional regulator
LKWRHLSGKSEPPLANRTLVNGLRLLERIAAECRAFSVAELSEALELPKSHVHRLLRTLVQAGYVMQSADTRKYRSDYRLLALAGPFAGAIPLRVYGGPVLRMLAESTRSDAFLAVLHLEAPLIIMNDYYRGRISAHTLAWMRLSRHASAFGKLFLAIKRLPVEAVELQRFTPATITTLRDLNAELALIRQRGYAVNRRENGEIFSFAAPVRSSMGELLGAIGLAVAPALLERQGEEYFINHLLESARTLSAQPLEP